MVFANKNNKLSEVILAASKYLDSKLSKNSVGYDAHYETRIILAHILGKDISYTYSHDDRILTDLEFSQFESWIKVRAGGVPLAYLLESCDFWDLTLYINKSVLVPRNETELIIEKVLEKFLDKFKNNSKENKSLNILDLGTGSGAIALALAKEFGGAKVVATDVSIDAIEVARMNSVNNKINNIFFLQGSWYEALLNKDFDNKFDIICSNPPYIDFADTAVCESVKKFEPEGALFCEDNGLACLKDVISGAKNYLKSGGWIFLEHGYQQAKDVRGILEDNGFTKDSIETFLDLGGNPRVSVGRLLK
jgi:release factor glutamine methyltransferase